MGWRRRETPLVVIAVFITNPINTWRRLTVTTTSISTNRLWWGRFPKKSRTPSSSSSCHGRVVVCPLPSISSGSSSFLTFFSWEKSSFSRSSSFISHVSLAVLTHLSAVDSGFETHETLYQRWLIDWSTIDSYTICIWIFEVRRATMNWMTSAKKRISKVSKQRRDHGKRLNSFKKIIRQSAETYNAIQRIETNSSSSSRPCIDRRWMIVGFSIILAFMKFVNRAHDWIQRARSSREYEAAREKG